MLLCILCENANTSTQKTHSLTSKGSVTAGDNDSSDVAVNFEGIEGLSHLPHQPVTQSIERLWPVQLDETHIVLLTSLFHQNILILTACMKRKQTLMIG